MIRGSAADLIVPKSVLVSRPAPPRGPGGIRSARGKVDITLYVNLRVATGRARECFGHDGYSFYKETEDQPTAAK
jgi:hypothetical protein